MSTPGLAVPIVIEFSHVVANDTPEAQASECVAEPAAELIKGRAHMEVYANSTHTTIRKRSTRCNAMRCRSAKNNSR